MFPIVPDYNGQHGYYNWQGNNLDRREVGNQRKFSHSSQNNNNSSSNTNFLTILEGYSNRQALAQISLNSLQEYDGTNIDITIQWLDHIKMVAEKTGTDPSEVGISKLKGLALGDINTICKGGNLTCYSFRQRLIEHYSNVPYKSNAMFAYFHLLQGDEKPTAQYLVRAKVLLECIHHTTKLSSISGSGWDNMYLVRELKAPYIRKRVAKEQDFWRMMQDVFDTINCITRMEERTKIYSEPNLQFASLVSKEWVHEVGTGKHTGQNPSSKTYNGSQCRHKLMLISGVAIGNIIVNPIGTRVVTSLTEDRGSWCATTAKGNITSGTMIIY